jgi:structural toxin protein (hemagglutinin/hemolysin) RtxA
VIKISVYVPESHLEKVKQAMFSAGAGKSGNYDQCAWQTLGIGQFRPLPGSTPYCGSQGELSRITEYSLETICQQQNLAAVIAALKQAHPYEEPAYAAWPILPV